MDYSEVHNNIPISDQMTYTPENYKVVTDALRDLIADRSRPLVIAVDGAAASGKGSLAEGLQELGYKTFSFGEFVRVLSWYYVYKKYTPETELQFLDEIKKIEIKIEDRDSVSVIVLTLPDGEVKTLDPKSSDSSSGLRSSEINSIVSRISRMPEVVIPINEYLRSIVSSAFQTNRAFAAEGRDNWKIFDREDTDAQNWFQAMLLIYLTASNEELDRRSVIREEKRLGRSLTDNEKYPVIKRVRDRNEDDSKRNIGRLVLRPEAEEMVAAGRYDAIVDSTHLTPEQTLFAVAVLQLQKIALIKSQQLSD